MFSLVLCFSVVAQKDKNKTQINPGDKSRNFKKEVNRVYKDWLNKDVPYIITSDETKAFKTLATDEEREAFIENFWRRRDPDPDTEENEFREQYYERIAYANEHYASGIPGWKTDRGRTYIRFGKPDGIESHPSGGQYDRPSYEGGGSTTTYPFETWFYRHLDNVGDGIEIEFVDPTGTGEYRIARNANEKDALLYMGGGQTLNEQLGLETRGDRISGINNGRLNFQREQDSAFRRLEILNSLERAPQVKYADLEKILGNTDTPLIDDALNFEVRVDFFRQTDDKIVTAFTVQADNGDLVFNDSNSGFQTARLNIFGRIQAVSGKRVGTFEDAVTTDATVEELADAKNRKSAYQKSYPLTPGGTYKVDVVVRDVASGKKGVKSIGFTVPKYTADKLSTSTLVLASKLATLSSREIGGQFTIGDKKVIPNVSGIYRKGQEVGVYLQVYNAGIDQTTLRPSVDVNYVLYKGGKEVGRQPENWSGLSDAGQRLTLARLISTQTLTAGDYELKINIKDRVSNESLEPSAKFSIKD
ncbi:MAG: GWxTD domain-containing protein [Pyrinomonadaceae bacterium]|nr:GWxTD domain-containing protein [Pyrinomonadaceae bacterium]